MNVRKAFLLTSIDRLHERRGKFGSVWENLLEMERFSCYAGERDQGAITLFLDLAKAFERVCLPVVWAWATLFNVPRKILRVLCGHFEHQQKVQFEECVAEPWCCRTL